jgi:tetratricopeptide (TPR) repeat protein
MHSLQMRCTEQVAIKLQCHWRGRGARKFHRSLLTIKRVENRGDDAFQRRWFEEAVLEYSDADKLCQGEVPRLKCKRAAAFTALGMYKEAVEDCDRVLRVQPSYAAAYRRKATALYAMGQFLEARQSYLACLEITPDDAEAARLLARLTTVLELRKRAQGDSSSQVPRSQLLIQRAQVLSNSIERAWNRPVPRPKPVPRELERMRRAASYHQKLADRGQSVYELQVQVDAAGNYKTVQRPKSRPSNGDRLTDSLEQTASKVQVAQTEVLHLPPIDAHVA